MIVRATNRVEPNVHVFLMQRLKDKTPRSRRAGYRAERRGVEGLQRFNRCQCMIVGVKEPTYEDKP